MTRMFFTCLQTCVHEPSARSSGFLDQNRSSLPARDRSQSFELTPVDLENSIRTDQKPSPCEYPISFSCQLLDRPAEPTPNDLDERMWRPGREKFVWLTPEAHLLLHRPLVIDRESWMATRERLRLRFSCCPHEMVDVASSHNHASMYVSDLHFAFANRIVEVPICGLNTFVKQPDLVKKGASHHDARSDHTFVPGCRKGSLDLSAKLIPIPIHLSDHFQK